MKLPKITTGFFFSFLFGYPLVLLVLLGLFYFLYCDKIQLGWIYLLMAIIPLAIILYFIGIAYCTRYVLNNATDKPEQKCCQYCSGEPAGPYLCSHCKSILWYNIKGKHALETSIFLLEHRWEFISAIGALFVVLPLSLLFTRMSELQKQNETELSNNMKSINILLDNLSVTRSKINYLESLGSISYDMEVWNDVNSSYTNIYWNLPSTFERLLKSTRDNNSKFDEAFTATKNKIEFNKTNKKYSIKTSKDSLDLLKQFKDRDAILYQKALLMNHPGLELSGVNQYMEYANYVSRCQELIATGNIARQDINSRKVIYHRLRVTSLMLRNLLDYYWLLDPEKKGRYDSEVADPKFYFNTIFVHYSTPDSLFNSIINLDFNFKARGFNAYEPLDSVIFNIYKLRAIGSK